MYFPPRNSNLCWSYPKGEKASTAFFLGNLPLGNTIERVTGTISKGKWEVESNQVAGEKICNPFATGLKLSSNFKESGEALEIIYNINCVY